uniref:Glutathione synthetase n=1 Tax=Oryza barthii TaxID=65489 RepID=A0A0D3HPC9_9ORYZ
MSSCVTTPHHHHHGCFSGSRRRRRLLQAPAPRARPLHVVAAAAFLKHVAPPPRCAVASRAMSAEAPLGVTPAAAAAEGEEMVAVVDEMAEEAAVWCAVHGLVVGDRAEPEFHMVLNVDSRIEMKIITFFSENRSGTLPGVGLVHAPFALLPTRFPASFWKQARELAPIFNDLVDRVSLDGEFLQDSLSRTRQVDDFTSRLLDIHAKMMEVNKEEFIRTLLNRHGKVLGLDSKRIPQNWAATQFAEALSMAWTEFNNKRDGQTVSVVYFRAGYSPNDYPSEAEWRARLLMEQSSAIKCPSISYHLVGTKKIQQELAKPNILERFLNNKEDISKLRKCFAGLWSLDNEEIVKTAIEKPDLFVLKPQREGGGNNIYGHDLRETLVRLQKEQGEALAAYILMQRIFPRASLTHLVQGGVCFEDLTISELGIFGAYLRNKDKVVLNNQCGYLMRTKVSSSNEGGVAAGFAVLDSILLTDE